MNNRSGSNAATRREGPESRGSIRDEAIAAEGESVTHQRKDRQKGREPESPSETNAAGGTVLDALMKQGPFGPAFFLVQLRALVREHCPDPSDGLPAVRLALADGEALEVCHVMGVGPLWVALAAHEVEHRSSTPAMRTEFVPYSMITRVTLRPSRAQAPHHGFDPECTPRVFEGAMERDAPEASLRRAAGSSSISSEPNSGA